MCIIKRVKDKQLIINYNHITNKMSKKVKEIYCMPCNFTQCEDYCNCEINESNNNLNFSEVFNHILPQQNVARQKIILCKFKDCKNIARFGARKYVAGTHCDEHKTKNMALVKHKPMCIEEECIVTPIFNFSNQKKGIYCNKHKKPDMVDVVNPKCTYEGCKQQPTYGLDGKKASRCKTHKTEEMVDVKHLKCKNSSCMIRASFNTPGLAKPAYCVEHKKADMIDVISDRCIHEGCNVQSSFGIPGKKATHCVKHKSDNMVDVVHNVCIHSDCKVRPTYGVEGTKKALYCEDHKKFSKDELVNVVSKMCEFKGCNILANFNLVGQSAKFCITHKSNDMVDVAHVKCKSELCDTRPSAKYDGYCLYCYVHLFPDKEVSRNYKTKEQAVLDFIKAQFPKIDWVHDKIVGKSLKRPDILANLDDKVIIIEIDENQHQSYQDICENKRLMQISQDLNHKNMVLIRFNPDKYTDRATINPSCWKLNKKGLSVISDEKMWTQRLDTLKDKVKSYIKQKPTKMIEIVQLFFDK